MTAPLTVATTFHDDDDELAHELGPEFRVVRWDLDHALPDDAHVALVDGLAHVTRAAAAPVHLIALLWPGELGELGQAGQPSRLTDFAVKPARPAELAARVRRVAGQPAWPLRQLHDLMTLAVARTSDVVEIATPSAVLQYVNPAYEALLGIAPAEAIGKTPAQLVRSDAHSPEFFRELDRTLSAGTTWSGTLISKRRDGRMVHFDTTITPISDATGAITHHMAVKRDITAEIERRQALLEANRALTQARDAAVAASRAKSEFLANMSHELRTPLNAIIGYSEMLLEDLGGDEQVHKDLQRIRSAGSHLLALINDVLDFSKIEADRVQLSPERIDVAELAGAVAETIRPLARKNRNRFELRCAPDAGAIFADRTRLQQVLFNLLSNACKFTKDGDIELAVALAPAAAGAPRTLELRVRDTGIGITPEQQANLFQPFVQADSSTTREYGGTGLGLVICRRLVELMGGTIALASARGEGTTFTVTLPADLERSSVALELRLDRDDARPLVLLIDDDVDVRDAFTRTMTRRGFRVQLAGTGPQGVELAARLRPDAIVLDVKMPGMSGWDVLSALKLAERTAPIPVIMLTVLQEQAVGQALGAVDYLIKPLDPDLLTATLRRHLHLAPAHVLVVEDDEPTRELIARTLTSAGHHVSTAENGQVALDRLAGLAPDLVVLDLMMPVMDGFSFLQHLRARPEHAELPVIVATARDLSGEERDALRAKVQRVIEKQAHTRDQLLDVIGSQIAALVEKRAGAP